MEYITLNNGAALYNFYAASVVAKASLRKA